MNKFLTLLSVLLITAQSHALFEARLGYGINTLSDKTYQGVDFKQMSGFNLDAIVEPPFITDLGIGLRYEMMSMDHGSSAKVDMDRLSLLVNYRIIDFFAYFGPIATYAITNTAKYKVGSASTDLDEKATYSVGLEGGVNLGLFSVGAELGKMFGKFTLPADGSTIDIGSIYIKVLAGVGF